MFAGRTFAKVACVDCPLLVVTFRWFLALLPALWRTGCLLPATGHQSPAGITVAGYFLGLVAGIARASVTGRDALVILTGELLSAELLARRTVSVTTFPIACMLPAIAFALALGLTSVLPHTRNLFLFQPASTGLDHHLQAVSAGSAVTTLGAHVLSASQHFSAGISASRGCQCAWEFVLGLPTGTLPDLAQRTRRTSSLVADNVTDMVSALERFVAPVLALPHRLCTLPLLLVSLAVTELN